MERAPARVCREAGSKVTTNTRLNDLNLDHTNRQDTTLVFPLIHPAGQCEGAALQGARKSKEPTYPELFHSRRCGPVVLAIGTGTTFFAY